MDSDTQLLFGPPKKRADIPERFGTNLGKTFDAPTAHRNDPISSFRAGDKVLKSGRLRGQTQAVLEALRKYPGRTSAELAGLADLDRYAVARRLPNLAYRGLAERGPERECTVCSTPCITWRPL